MLLPFPGFRDSLQLLQNNKKVIPDEGAENPFQ